MKQEEILDQLLEERYYQGSWRLVSDDTLADSLAAAERLTQLQEIDVPADFAVRLEHALRTRAHSSDSDQQSGRIVLGKTDILSRLPHSRSTHARRTPKRRAWAAILGIAAVLILAFTCLLAFSARSQPGHSHPPVSATYRELRETPLPTTAPQNSVSTNITLLQSALDDLRTVVGDQRSDEALALALKTVADRTSACRSAVAALPTSSQQTTAQQDLSTVLAQEDQTLRQVLPQLDWPMRLLFTHQLSLLGDPVPTLTHATVHMQSNGTFLVTLTGTHFAQRSVFLLNGLPRGTVSLVTSGQLVVIIPSSLWLPGSHALGVLNPDGTAAQLLLKENDTGGE